MYERPKLNRVGMPGMSSLDTLQRVTIPMAPGCQMVSSSRRKKPTSKKRNSGDNQPGSATGAPGCS